MIGSFMGRYVRRVAPRLESWYHKKRVGSREERKTVPGVPFPFPGRTRAVDELAPRADIRWMSRPRLGAPKNWYRTYGQQVGAGKQGKRGILRRRRPPIWL